MSAPSRLCPASVLTIAAEQRLCVQVLELGKDALLQVATAMGPEMTPEELCKAVEELGRTLH